MSNRCSSGWICSDLEAGRVLVCRKGLSVLRRCRPIRFKSNVNVDCLPARHHSSSMAYIPGSARFFMFATTFEAMKDWDSENKEEGRCSVLCKAHRALDMQDTSIPLISVLYFQKWSNVDVVRAIFIRYWLDGFGYVLLPFLAALLKYCLCKLC